jgi:S-sulfosulfanyl-L-cysteine sulfohydrolase
LRHRTLKFWFLTIALASAAGLAACVAPLGEAAGTQITLVHMGDLHGHLAPRPNVRSDAQGQALEGGAARMYTRIREIRAANPNSLLINTGDTVQGSAEALFTRGQAVIEVLNHFGIDAFAPGNWEFVYGTQRFAEMFAGPKPAAPWNAVAANVFYDGAPHADKTGQRVLPPYVIKQVGGVKVGILGLTTDRGPQVVGRNVTQGLRFLRNAKQAGEALSEIDAEVKRQIEHLRNVEKVQLLVLASEMGLANNLRIAEAVPGIDVVLSSDMHEQTRAPVITAGGTMIVEEGQDGTMIGQIDVRLVDGKVASKRFTPHPITDRIAADPGIAALVAEQRAPFLAGARFNGAQANPFNGVQLKTPIDTVIGATAGALHRSNFANEPMPAVVEGSAHNFLADAMRAAGNAEIGAIRGFRYGTHVPPGPLRYEDLYHFMPIGAQVAVGKIKGQQLKQQIEAAADGSLNPDVSQWTGGWLFGYAGVTMDFDAYQPRGARASNVRVGGAPLDAARDYSYASYWYAADPALVNTVAATDVRVLKENDGSAIDGVEVVARHVRSLPNATVPVVSSRIKLLKPLPTPKFGNPEVQPLRGAQP